MATPDANFADETLAQRQIVAMPNAADPALRPADDARWTAIQEAHETIDAMNWGARLTVEDAIATIRSWITA